MAFRMLGRFASGARTHMGKGIKAYNKTALESNGAINPITTSVKDHLMRHAPGIMGGGIIGGAWGAYDGAMDPRSGTFGGAVWGGLTGAVKGVGLGYAGSGAYRYFRGGRRAPVNTPLLLPPPS